LRYRAALLEVVSTVIRQAIPEAERYVTDWTKRNVPADDQTLFIVMACQELESLHDGNIARFNLRPAEFAKWREKK
jgi:hypothetical protein